MHWDSITPAIVAVAPAARELFRWLRSRPMKAEVEYLTIPRAALRIGITDTHLRRMFERELVPPVPIVGGRRMVPADRLEGLKEAARKEGYLD